MAEKEEALHRQAEDGEPTHDETLKETEGNVPENPNLEGREMCEGETPIADEILEGETPIAVEMCEGETPIAFEVREGETPGFC